MSTHRLDFVQLIPASMDKVWNFFSNPSNLADITPPGMKFTVISSPEKVMYPGQIIEYKVSPFSFYTTYWMTEITHVQQGKMFVDEQRFGPYALWHHQHHFAEKDGGVEMRDIVHYRLPFGFIGDIADTLFVQKKLESIFRFRREITEKMFSQR